MPLSNKKRSALSVLLSLALVAGTTPAIALEAPASSASSSSATTASSESSSSATTAPAETATTSSSTTTAPCRDRDNILLHHQDRDSNRRRQSGNLEEAQVSLHQAGDLLPEIRRQHQPHHRSPQDIAGPKG